MHRFLLKVKKMFCSRQIFVLLFILIFILNSVNSHCTFSDILIHEYNNGKGTTALEVESQDIVGIGSSVHASAGVSRYSGISRTRSHGVGAYLGVNFFGISANLKAEVSKSSSISNSRSSSWNLASHATWSKQSTRTTKYSVLPGMKVKIWQEVAQCGQFTVRNSKIRREDVDATPEELLNERKKVELNELNLIKYNISAHIDILSQQLNQTHERVLRKIDAEMENNKRKHEIIQKETDDARNIKQGLIDGMRKMSEMSESLVEKLAEPIHDITLRNFTHHSNLVNSRLQHQQDMEKKKLQIELDISRLQHQQDMEEKKLQIELYRLGLNQTKNKNSFNFDLDELTQSQDVEKFYEKLTNRNSMTQLEFLLLLIVLVLIVICGLIIYVCYFRRKSNPNPSSMDKKFPFYTQVNRDSTNH